MTVEYEAIQTANSSKRKKVVISIFLIVFVCLVVLVSSSDRAIKILDSAGVISYSSSTSIDVSIFTNSSRLENVTSIYWGEIYPGQTKSYTVYCYNSGSASAILTLLNATNMNPSVMNNYLKLTSNYSNQTIPSDTGINLILNLSLATNITSLVFQIKNFSFDIRFEWDKA